MTALNDASCESPDANAGVSPAELRDARAGAPPGPPPSPAADKAGEPVGTTANAVTSLSLDPPLILVCFDRRSSTLTAIRRHGAFAVHVLAQRQRQLSANFAKRGLAAVWEGVTHHRGPTGSPRLANVIA